MSADITLFKASIAQDVGVDELESLIAANGGVIHRIDQAEGTTAVFFSGDAESGERCGKSLARYGKVAVDPSSEDDLRKLP